VGHVQGGISLALAAATANRALGEEWMLSSIAAWYVSPGIGREIRGRARIAHLGRRTAVVQTTLTNDGADAMLQATSSHARRAAS
jgi:acyl-coenzyme A thioesterase PaaI-like protein